MLFCIIARGYIPLRTTHGDSSSVFEVVMQSSMGLYFELRNFLQRPPCSNAMGQVRDYYRFVILWHNQANSLWKKPEQRRKLFIFKLDTVALFCYPQRGFTEALRSKLIDENCEQPWACQRPFIQVVVPKLLTRTDRKIIADSVKNNGCPKFQGTCYRLQSPTLAVTLLHFSFRLFSPIDTSYRIMMTISFEYFSSKNLGNGISIDKKNMNLNSIKI